MAIIDGQKKKKLSSFMGHQEGINSIRTTVKTAKIYGIKYLTLYSFSTENWSRPKKEVSFLIGFFSIKFAKFLFLYLYIFLQSTKFFHQ